MPNEKFSDLAHRIRRYEDDFAKQTQELSELRSELARLKQIVGTVREALRCIYTYSYKGGMRQSHSRLKFTVKPRTLLLRAGRTIRIVDAHRDDGKRFVVHAEEKLTTFMELESAALTSN